MLNISDSKKSHYKICNSINCFFSNEQMQGLDYHVNLPNDECKFCSYNYNKIHELQKFINQEVCKAKKIRSSTKPSNYAKKMSIFLVGIVLGYIGVYLIINFVLK